MQNKIPSLSSYRFRTALVIFAIAMAIALYAVLFSNSTDTFTQLAAHSSNKLAPILPSLWVYLTASLLFFAAGVVILFSKNYPKYIFIGLTQPAAVCLFVAAIVKSGNPFFLLLFMVVRPLLFVSALLQISSSLVLIVYFKKVNLKLSPAHKENVIIVDSHSAKDRLKFVMIIIGILFVPFAALLTSDYNKVMNYINPSRGYSNNIKQYLSGKYGEQFELTSFKTEEQSDSSLKTQTYLIATVHPASNSQVTFEVRGCILGCGYGGKGRWRDDYINKAWAYELKPKVSAEIAKIYGYMPKVSVSARIDNDMQNKTPEDKIVPFDSVKRFAFLAVEVEEPGYFTKENIKTIEDRVRRSVAHLSAYGVQRFTFSHTAHDPRAVSNQEYSTPDSEDQKYVRCFDSISISSEELGKFQSAQNLKEFFSRICSYDNLKGSLGRGVSAREAYPQ